jgi:hypothetical protein
MIRILIILAIIAGATLGLGHSGTALALDGNAETSSSDALIKVGDDPAEGCKSRGGKLNAKNQCVDNNGRSLNEVTYTLRNVVNLLLYVAGIIAVVIIVIAGFRFVASNGDATQVSKAKNTIIYALVGLVVAVMSYTIVNFILENI